VSARESGVARVPRGAARASEDVAARASERACWKSRRERASERMAAAGAVVAVVVVVAVARAPSAKIRSDPSLLLARRCIPHRRLFVAKATTRRRSLSYFV